MTSRKGAFPVPNQGNKKQWVDCYFVDESNIHGYLKVRNVM